MSKKHHRDKSVSVTPPPVVDVLPSDEPVQSPPTPAGLPPIAAPLDIEETEPPLPSAADQESLEKEYQTEQEIVSIVAMPPTCPRCGSTERTPLKEITPRTYNKQGGTIRYRTKCLGMITPLDRNGKPMLDSAGTPKSFCCGTRYKVSKFVVGLKPRPKLGRFAATGEEEKQGDGIFFDKNGVKPPTFDDPANLNR